MPTVAVKHVIKEGAVSLNRPLTGAVTANAYTVDKFGRTSVDTSDLPALLASGNWAVDGPANVAFYSGSGAPTLNATPGSLYVRTDGSSSSTRLYLNCSSGIQGTTWIAISTAS
jgi:hypothetical protein